MLRLNIQSLDDVPETDRGHYEPAADGGFELAVDGLDDKDALLRAKRREKDLRLAVEGKNRELASQVRQLQLRGQPAKPAGEMTPLDRLLDAAPERLTGLSGSAYQAELAKIEAEVAALADSETAAKAAEAKAEVESLTATVRHAMVNDAARRLLAEIARPGADALLLPHIVARLSCERRGEAWEVVVTDASGNATGVTIDGLKGELRSRPEFRPLIQGTSPAEIEAHARRVAAAIGQKIPSK